MISLIPCKHLLCKDCHQSPLVLVSCYGCPACGVMPSDYTVEEEKKISRRSSQSQGMVEEVEMTTTGDDDGFASFDYGTTAAASLYYTTSASSYVAEHVPVAPAPVEVTLTSIPVLCPFAATVEEEDGVYCASSFSHFAAAPVVAKVVVGAVDVASSSGCGVSSSSSTSNSSSGRKTRRGPRRKKNPTHADKFAVPSKPKVVVPAGCPDDQRPRTRPDPRTCREAGRRIEREELLGANHKWKEHQKRRTQKVCRDMGVF